MDGTWSLDELYLGFEDPQFSADFAALQELCGKFADFAGQNLTGKELVCGYLRISEELSDLAGKLMGYSRLRMSVNTGDAEAASWTGRIMALLSGTAGFNAGLQNRIAKQKDLDELIASDELCKEYAYYLTNLREDAKYLRSDGEEEILSKMNLSGASAWANLHSQLTSSLEVDYNGGVTTLSDIRNLAYSGDPAVRKAAYEAELKAYPKIAEPGAFAMNSIKQQVLTECSLRGFASPLEQTLHVSRMQRATLDAMLEAIHDYLPRFRAYMRRKGACLGHDNGLPWYDLFAPMGASSRTYSVPEAKEILLDLFGQFDESLQTMAGRAFDERWIDFFPRPGKEGGAFCAGVPSVKQSRVLTNFDGSFSSIVTIAHELGHAYHGQQIFSHRSLNQDYSMPLAETASTFNENLVMHAAIAGETDPQVKLQLLESRLQDLNQIIVDILSRYTVETDIFQSRPEQFMNAAALCEKMLAAQEYAYGDGLDPELRHPYMWLCKGHYYMGLSFYNFPYAFGGLFAGGLYAMYRQEGKAFVPKYQKLLHTTTVASVEDTAGSVGIDLTKRDFWAGALETISEEIETFLDLTK